MTESATGSSWAMDLVKDLHLAMGSRLATGLETDLIPLQ